jgi:hypothetical protein
MIIERGIIMQSKILLIGFVIFIATFSGCNSIEKDVGLTNNDFMIEYNDFIISESTTVDELIENLGYGSEEDYYYNNQGYISTVGELQVFALYYPAYENTKLRVVYYKNISDDTSYILFLELYAGTQRGIKLGDNEQIVIEAYGEPDEIIINNGISTYYYYFEEKSFQVMFSEGILVFIAINFRTDILT